MTKKYISLIELSGKMSKRINKTTGDINAVPYIKRHNLEIEDPIWFPSHTASDGNMGQLIEVVESMTEGTYGYEPYRMIQQADLIEIPYILEFDAVKNSGCFNLTEKEWSNIKQVMALEIILYGICQQIEDLRTGQGETIDITKFMENSENWPVYELDLEKDPDGADELLKSIYGTMEQGKVSTGAYYKKQTDCALKAPLSSEDAAYMIEHYIDKIGLSTAFHLSQLILPFLMSFFVMEKKTGVFDNYDFTLYKVYKEMISPIGSVPDTQLNTLAIASADGFSYGFYEPISYLRRHMNSYEGDSILLKKITAQICLQIKKIADTNPSILSVNELMNTVTEVKKVTVLLNNECLNWGDA